jgi:hypothetical protein
VRFRDVTLEGLPGDYLVQIQGADVEHDVRGVTFENVAILGSKLTRESAQLRMGEHASEVRFEEKAQPAR